MRAVRGSRPWVCLSPPLLLSSAYLSLVPAGEIFPNTPWLFLFRKPHEVLASACPEPASGCRLGALGGRAVTEADVSKCASSAQRPLLRPRPTHLPPNAFNAHRSLDLSVLRTNGLRYLETLMGRGIRILRRSHADGDRLGMAVDYSSLVLATEMDVILGHLQLSASAQERAAVAEVLGYDIKASYKQKGLVPFDGGAHAARKKAIVEASPELIRISSDLDSVYTELLQLAAPWASVRGPAALSLQHPKEGQGLWQAHRVDHVSQHDPDMPGSSPTEEHLDSPSRTLGWAGRLAAAAAITHPEPGGVASEKQPGNSFDTGMTPVAPGMFDEPLEWLGEGQHGRGLGSCVSIESSESALGTLYFNASMKLNIALDSRHQHHLLHHRAELRAHL